MANLLTSTVFRSTKLDGSPNALGKVHFYAAGTLVDQETYTTPAGNVPNDNPVILAADGTKSIFLDDTLIYRVIEKTAADEVIRDRDNIGLRGDSIAIALADDTDAVNGAGMVGYRSSLDYADGTVGAYLKSLTTSEGAALTGFVQGGTGAVSRTVEDKLRELAVSVTDFDADMTGATDSSRAVYNAQVYAQSIGAAVFIPPGVLRAAIDVRYSDAAIIGAGSTQTEVRIPTAQVAVSFISFTANVGTVTCASTSNLWVGRSVRIHGTSNSTHNDAFIVTAVDSSTQFKMAQKNATITGTSTGGVWMAANVLECGALCDGNDAAEYEGLVVRGLTLNGMRGTRPSPVNSDLSDWGLALTKFSRYDISDVVGVDCWNAGIAAFINSNYGRFHGRVKNCGFSNTNPAGFDINSSKHFTFEIVAEDCANGIRLLDNCWNITGQAAIYNASTIGALFNNQSLNESHNCNIKVTVEGGCSSDGVQIGTKFRNSVFTCAVSGVTGIGVREVYIATAANRPGSNRIQAITKGCGQSAAVIGGDGSTWDVVSYLDGRTGGAGSAYAIQVDGQRNIITANVTDSSTPQVRGVNLTATSAGNRVDPFIRNTLVSDFADSGSGNSWTSSILRGSKTYDAPSLATGAQTSTTVTVTGCATGRGDIASARYNANIGGVTLYAEVTATDTVTVWLTNQSAGTLDLGSGTLYVSVDKGTP